MDNNGFNYDAIRALHEPQSSSHRLQQSKLFTLTHSMNQMENLPVTHGQSRIPNLGLNINSNTYRPSTNKSINTKRTTIFPALQHLKEKQENNTNQMPARQPLQPKLFSTPRQAFFTRLPQTNSDFQPPSDINMKLEQLSDKVFSSSPPPQCEHDTHISNQECQNVNYQYDREQFPKQMLPPPPPPIGPDSRPPSPLRPRPTPAPESSRSRSGSANMSSTFGYGDGDHRIGLGLGIEDQEQHQGDEGQGADGTSDIAIRALRGMQAVKAELDGERRRSKSLIAQLNTLAGSHEELVGQHTSMREELASTQQRLEDTTRASAAVKDELSVVSLQLKDELAKLEEARAEVIEARRQETEAISEGKRLKDKQEAARRKLHEAKRAMGELGDMHDGLQVLYVEMKTKFEGSNAALKELKEARARADEGLLLVGSLLDEEGNYRRGKEVRELVEEAQSDLADSRRVIDLLRDKLHAHATQLADAQARIKELEEEERMRLFEWARRNDLDGNLLKGYAKSEASLTAIPDSNAVVGSRTRVALVAATDKMDTLLERLVKREEEAVDAMVEARGYEERVSVMLSKAEEMEKEITMLKEFRDSKNFLEIRLEEQLLKTQGVEETLNAVETVKDTLKGECATLYAQLDAAKTKTEELKFEVQAHKEALDDAGKKAAEAEERRKQAELRVSVTQERFDAQAITLRLTKEQCGDLQERLHISETALEQTRREAKAEIAKMREEGRTQMDELRKTEMQLSKTHERLEAQRACLEREEKRLEKAEQKSSKADVQYSALQKRFDAQCATSVKQLSDLLKLQERSEAHDANLKQEVGRCGDLQERLQKAEEVSRKVEVRFSKLQERFDAQAASLKQTEQRYEELQKANAKLTAKFDTSQVSLDQTTQQLLAERASLAVSAENFAETLVRREEEVRRLRAEEVDMTMGVVERLKHRVAELEYEVTAERARVDMAVDGKDSNKAMELELVVERLRSENEVLMEKVGGMKKRYEGGQLTDEEKDFVEWLMKLAGSLHEQDDVAKDNELRRRENLNVKNQAKIRELESSLARLLKQQQKEAGDQTNSMIDLNAWVTSSPLPAIESPAHPVESITASISIPGTVNPQETIIAPSTKTQVPAPASASVPEHQPTSKKAFPVKRVPVIVIPAAIRTRDSIRSFSSLDSLSEEEDIPLSDQFPSSAAPSVLGKRDRPVSPIVKCPPQPVPQPPVVATYGHTRRLRGAGTASRPVVESLVVPVSPVVRKKAETNGKTKKKRK